MENRNNDKILKRYLAGAYSLKDHLTVKRWFKDDKLFSNVKDKIVKDWEETSSDIIPDETQVKRMYTMTAGRILQEEFHQKSFVFRYRQLVYRIAAALVIGVFIGIAANSLMQKDPQPVYYTAFSPKGSVSEMQLPDGTTIMLNSDSRIKYSINGEDGNREVFLEGEAWFDVAKQDGKPFIVQTPYYVVNVLGTKFNVKAYSDDDEVVTTLEEGSIKIGSTKKLNLKEEVQLKPGEQLSYTKSSKELTLKKVNTEWYTSWKENKLILVNMSLKDFVIILERKYGVDIELKDEQILGLHVDCTIKNESIFEILNLLKRTLPLDYEVIGQKIVVKSN